MIEYFQDNTPGTDFDFVYCIQSASGLSIILRPYNVALD